MHPTIDVAVVGGGVIGLAAACAAAARGRAACVIERLPRPGLAASTVAVGNRVAPVPPLRSVRAR